MSIQPILLKLGFFETLPPKRHRGQGIPNLLCKVCPDSRPSTLLQHDWIEDKWHLQASLLRAQQGLSTQAIIPSKVSHQLAVSLELRSQSLRTSTIHKESYRVRRHFQMHRLRFCIQVVAQNWADSCFRQVTHNSPKQRPPSYHRVCRTKTLSQLKQLKK